MTKQALKAPFPYFGGKSRIAAKVWSRFGEKVHNYVEPFFGSGAVLLSKPFNRRRLETINDADGFVANFWRAVQADPVTVAKYVDWPVNECDLEARHKALCSQPGKKKFLRQLKNDPDYFDTKKAAWWCWGLCCWIGTGWCSGEWFGHGDDKNHGCGVCNGASKLPFLAAPGKGVNRKTPKEGKIPHLSHAGQGVYSNGISKKMPVMNSGRGVNRKSISLQIPIMNSGWGINRKVILQSDVVVHWFQQLSDRLRKVRVCCGNWDRIMGPAVTEGNGTTAVFLDPPYAAEDREECYREESYTVAHDVLDWCKENGDHRKLRIALCGYEGSGNEVLEEQGWSVLTWKAQGGYANIHAKNPGKGNANKYRERIWFSPHCLQPGTMRKRLFSLDN